MILAGVILVIAAVVVLLVANPFGDADRRPRAASDLPDDASPADADSEQNDAATQPEPVADEATDPEPEARPADEPASPAAADQTSLSERTVTVRSGDTLYEIAGRIWSDPFLWPLLLGANAAQIEDPDYLRPGQSIEAPAWVTVDSGLTEAQRARLSEAHVLAYRHYRDLGDGAIGLGMGQPEWWRERLGRIRLNKAHWVLYSGLRYDPELLDRYAGSIRDHDVAEVRSYVERFGLPPNRR